MKRAISIFYSYFCYGRPFDANHNNNRNGNENNYVKNVFEIEKQRKFCFLLCSLCFLRLNKENEQSAVGSEIWVCVCCWSWFFRYSMATRIDVIWCEFLCGMKCETAMLSYRVRKRHQYVLVAMWPFRLPEVRQHSANNRDACIDRPKPPVTDNIELNNNCSDILFNWNAFSVLFARRKISDCEIIGVFFLFVFRRSEQTCLPTSIQQFPADEIVLWPKAGTR